MCGQFKFMKTVLTSFFVQCSRTGNGTGSTWCYSCCYEL